MALAGVDWSFSCSGVVIAGRKQAIICGRAIQTHRLLLFCSHKMHRGAATVFLIVILCHGNQAQRPAFGKCPNPGSGKTLDLDRMKGRWYEIERSFYIYELNRRCISMDFTPEGSGLRITTKAVSRMSDSSVREEAVARPIHQGSANFKLTVDTDMARRLPASLRRALPGSGDYAVLHTDYDNYAVVYSCSDIASILHADLIWVLARSRDLPVTSRLEIYGALERAGLGSDRLTLTPQRDCPSGR